MFWKHIELGKVTDVFSFFLFAQNYNGYN